MRASTLVGVDPHEAGDVVEEEQEIALEVLQG